MNESPDLGGVGLGDSSALEDAKAFNKGKGKLLAAMLAILLAALGVFAWYLVEDQPNPYSELGKQTNGFRTQYFDGFWVCALPGAQLGTIKSDADMRAELHTRGAAGARYGEHLRNKCGPLLRELGTRLRALIPPPDAAPIVKKMAESATKLTVGMDAYATYLEGLEGAYDQAAAESQIETPVRAWYDFRKSAGELNTLVREQLGR